jgi:transcriptional regulator with XRE-family HTH domain
MVHMSSPVVAVTPFGAALRRWRLARGVSQLALANLAATTTRHVSFLETGRSRPSGEMVARLAEALELPLREANELFRAAGLAAAFPETPLAAEDLAPFNAVVEQMLSRHHPYPAYAIDRHWNIVRTNRAASTLLPEDAERNLVRLTYAGPWRALIANWSDIAWVGARRLQTEAAQRPDDEELAALVSLATEACHGVPERSVVDGAPVLCPHFRVGDRLVRTITVVAQFGAARDVTLDELRIELVYPADDEADAFFRSHL